MRQYLLFAAAVLGVVSSRSAEWWKKGVLYQIYPRSFADSKGDGNGTLQGILDHVPYLHSLGVDVVWLSPIYQSPWEDMGYDISDYKDVHPVFGTLQDVRQLIAALHKVGMKLVLDLVPNHSSHQHPWFVESKKDRTNSKADFYVWKDPKGFKDSKPIPPNNWLSQFGGSAWEYVPERQQFYLHQFGTYQPDWNYTNPAVVEAMKHYLAGWPNMYVRRETSNSGRINCMLHQLSQYGHQDNMRFWLDIGIDGFRVDAVPFLVEDPQMRDEPEGKPIHTQNQPETYKVLDSFNHMIVQEYPHTYLFLEAYSSQEDTMKYFNTQSSPFNFAFITDFTNETNAEGLKNIVDSYIKAVPHGKPFNWVMSNHDQPRVSSRVGEELIDALNMLNLMLPGVAVTYQGDEIGMVGVNLRADQKKDCCGRDPERTPFQWSPERNAGFSKAKKTWLPVNPDFWRVNVQTESKSPTSHLSTYKELVQLRKDLSKKMETAALGKHVFAFTREMKNKHQTYYVLINLSNEEEEVDMTKAFKDVPKSLIVRLPSDNSGFGAGERIYTDNVSMRPKSGLVLQSGSLVHHTAFKNDLF